MERFFKFYSLIILFFITITINSGEIVYANPEASNTQSENVNEKNAGTEAHSTNIKESNSGNADVRVFIDPETGEKLTPKQARDRGLIGPENGLNFGSGPKNDEIIIEKPDGSITIIHPEGSQFNSNVHIDEKGKIHSECLKNENK